MPINNLEKLKKILVFEPNWFYEILIMKRRKDFGNEDMNKSVKIIKSYNITSIDSLEYKMDEIIKLCESFNARAYINPQPYSFDKLGFKIMEVSLKMIQDGNNDYNGIVSKAIGTMTPETKRWVVDIDNITANISDINRIKTVINDCSPNGDNILLTVDTPNGIHLITRPFNLQTFITYQDVYYKVEVKKDNPTILYCNIQNSKSNENR
jgi:hypothetical protein